jgi:GntR family transcriptional regulator
LLIRIDPAEPRPLYVQIVDEVRRAIVLRAVRPGEALPSVRQLASQLRVNPNTVRQAYGELERAGVLEMRRGQGTFLRDDSIAADEKRLLARSVAARALRDAFRHGLDVSELIGALQSEARRKDGGHADGPVEPRDAVEADTIRNTEEVG